MALMCNPGVGLAMAKSLADLHHERGRLLERIARERADLARELAPLQKISQAGDRVSAVLGTAVRYAKDHPLTLALVVAALVLLRPGRTVRVGKWLRRGLLVWRSWRQLRAWRAWAAQAVWREPKNDVQAQPR